jgi:Cupredoxin-like domain
MPRITHAKDRLFTFQTGGQPLRRRQDTLRSIHTDQEVVMIREMTMFGLRNFKGMSAGRCSRRLAVQVGVIGAAGTLLAACGAGTNTGMMAAPQGAAQPGNVALAGSTQVLATLSDTGCSMPTPSAKGPVVTFSAQNTGTMINEFYIYEPDGTNIVQEVENIAPGTAKTMTVQLNPGSYLYGCKPGMLDANLMQAPFTVS